MIKVNRKIGSLKKVSKQDEYFVDLTPQERILFMWELTQEVWSLKDKKSAQRRLQRNITKLIKKRR